MGLTSTDIGALTMAQLKGLTSTQIAALDPTTQLSGFSSTDIGALSNAQIGGLVSTEVGALSATQLKGLTSTQLGVLDAATQIDGLTSNSGQFADGYAAEGPDQHAARCARRGNSAQRVQLDGYRRADGNAADRLGVDRGRR